MEFIIIFEMAPEYTKIFRFIATTTEQVKLYKSCHNCYVNLTLQMEDKTSDFLIALSEGNHQDKEIYDGTSGENDLNGLYINGPMQIIVCGFML